MLLQDCISRGRTIPQHIIESNAVKASKGERGCWVLQRKHIEEFRFTADLESKKKIKNPADRRKFLKKLRKVRKKQRNKFIKGHKGTSHSDTEAVHSI